MRTSNSAAISAAGLPRGCSSVIHGTSDKTVPIDPSGRAAAKGVAGAKLIEYDGEPHGVFATQQDRLTQDLLTYDITGEDAQGKLKGRHRSTGTAGPGCCGEPAICRASYIHPLVIGKYLSQGRFMQVLGLDDACAVPTGG